MHDGLLCIVLFKEKNPFRDMPLGIADNLRSLAIISGKRVLELEMDLLGRVDDVVPGQPLHSVVMVFSASVHPAPDD